MSNPDLLVEPRRPIAEIFCLCRTAEVVDGTINIMGASTRLTPAVRSVVVPQVTVVLSVRFPVQQEGVHRYRVSSADLNGNPIAPPATGAINIVAAGDDVYAWMQLAVIVASRVFEAPGDFRFDLAIDDQHLASSWLCVVKE